MRAIENKRACSYVAGHEVICREGLGSLADEIENVAQGCRFVCGRVVLTQESAQVGYRSIQELDELDDGHLGAIAAPRAQLHDPGVAAGAVGVAGTDIVEELGNHLGVLDLA